MARVLESTQKTLEILSSSLTHTARHAMPYIAENHGVSVESIKRAAWMASCVMEGVYMPGTAPDFLAGTAG